MSERVDFLIALAFFINIERRLYVLDFPTSISNKIDFKL